MTNVIERILEFIEYLKKNLTLIELILKIKYS